MNRAAGAPAIGWFTLSEADRAAAARYLSSLASDGTRDELGFAPIHFAVADRFFPGTSVQHAQLRYVFFAAWTYQELLREGPGSAFSDDRLAGVEARFSERLMKYAPQLANSGISGWTRYQKGRKPVVRVSQIYWGALKTWGLLSGWAGSGQPPNQTDVHRAWARLVSYDEGGDGVQPVQSGLFDPALPAPPSNWPAKAGSLTFELQDREKTYIRRRWRGIGGGAPPLLSRLADAGIAPESLWDSAVAALATPEERTLLHMARQAAALSCIARAVHSVLIENRRNEELERSDSKHAEALAGIVAAWRDDAVKLDVAALRAATGFDGALETFLILIQEWIARNGVPGELLEPIARREHDLKGPRAYLSNKERRQVWRKATAQPLDYRWPAVRNLIASVV